MSIKERKAKRIEKEDWGQDTVIKGNGQQGDGCSCPQ
jgi:hypothetical protein